MKNLQEIKIYLWKDSHSSPRWSIGVSWPIIYEIPKFKTSKRNRDVVNSFDRHLTTGERNYSQSKIPYAWTWIRNKPEICFNIPLIKKHKLTKAKIISMICHEIFHVYNFPVYNFPVSENFTSPIPTKYSNYHPELWAEFFWRMVPKWIF